MKRMRVVSRKLRPDNKNLDRSGKNLFNKTLFVNVTQDLHNSIKRHAIERNISVRLWVTRAVIRNLKKELETE